MRQTHSHINPAAILPLHWKHDLLVINLRSGGNISALHITNSTAHPAFTAPTRTLHRGEGTRGMCQLLQNETGATDSVTRDPPKALSSFHFLQLNTYLERQKVHLFLSRCPHVRLINVNWIYECLLEREETVKISHLQGNNQRNRFLCVLLMKRGGNNGWVTLHYDSKFLK